MARPPGSAPSFATTANASYSRSVEFFVTATPRSIFAQPGVETTSRSTFRGHMRIYTRLHTRVYHRVRAPLCTFPPLVSNVFAATRALPIEPTAVHSSHERERERGRFGDVVSNSTVSKDYCDRCAARGGGSANVDNGITRDARAEDTRLGLFSLVK